MEGVNFKKTLIIRSIAYFFIIIGSLAAVFEFGPFVLSESAYRFNRILGVRYKISSAETSVSPATPAPSGKESFGEILKTTEKLIRPVSTEYGIVIEKINANAKIIASVDSADQKAYTNALKKGVAEAKGSTKPGEEGNLFIFAHSAEAPWNVIRYNAVFYLLRELKSGDRVSIFYNDKRYEYEVFDKVIAEPKDVSFLINRYDKPVLTLQTCDPPGTLLKRLIVRAKLVGS